MKKTFALSIVFGLSIVPFSAHAAIISINGLTDTAQMLTTPTSTATTTMHMEMITSGTDEHQFTWDGTPWRVDQGGTGIQAFSNGGLLVGNGVNSFTTTFSPVVDSITASSTSATSTFAGNFSVAGDAVFGRLLRLSPCDHCFNAPVEGDDVLIVNENGHFDIVGRHLQLYAGDSGLGDGVGAIFTLSPSEITMRIDNPSDSASQGADITFTAGNAGGNSGTQGGDVFLGAGDGNVGGNIILDAGDAADPVDIGHIIMKTSGAATTTIDFGEIGNPGHSTCFNTKNTDGDDISFYFVGTSMVVENNLCN